MNATPDSTDTVTFGFSVVFDFGFEHAFTIAGTGGVRRACQEASRSMAMACTTEKR